MNNQPKARSVAPRGNKSSKSKKTKNSKRSVPGIQAQGTDRQGPLQLKTEQFAAYAPLKTFSVATGSTPGGIRIRGRELIQALNSGSSAVGGFGAANTAGAGSLVINPAVFPRLASYNNLYEFFIFHRCKAMFQSSRPTTAAGVMELAVDYDPKDAVPTTTIGMMRNISSSMSNIYADNALELSKSLSRLPKYATSEAASSDLSQVNQGLFLYAFEGLASTEVNTPQGYLVVEYDVEFFTPQ